MKLVEIIFNILWLLLGIAIIAFIVFTTIQEHIAGMIITSALLVNYIIDTKMLWWKNEIRSRNENKD
jgi:hypothetical protein